MRVLVHTYDTAFQNAAGGVRIRIEKIVSELRMAGVQVDYFDKYHTVIADYDILHIFKLDAGTRQLVEYAHAVGVKVVISTIVSIEKSWLINLYWRIRNIPLATVYRQLFAICRDTDLFIVETPREAKFIEKNYHIDRGKITTIPNGADKITCRSKKIYELIGEERGYALVVGRFDENKNQKAVIEAMADSDIDVVFIGGADPKYKAYYEECKYLASLQRNIHLLGWINSGDELFKSALCNASVIVCPSFNETFGLSIVEGVMAGAVPVVSNTLPILEFSGFKSCERFNPRSKTEIREKIIKVMREPERYSLSLDDTFSWKAVTEAHILNYQCISDNEL